MSGLSWLIYLAGIVDDVKSFFGVIGMLSLTGSVVIFFITRERWDDLLAERSYRKMIVPLGLLGFSLLILAGLTPGKETMMYIAASEYGQEAMKNPKVGVIANDSLDLLHTWIKNQIKEK